MLHIKKNMVGGKMLVFLWKKKLANQLRKSDPPGISVCDKILFRRKSRGLISF